MSQMYAMKITASGEVRDAEGNLVSAEPIEATIEVPEDHLKAMGLSEEQIETIKGEAQ